MTAVRSYRRNLATVNSMTDSEHVTICHTNDIIRMRDRWCPTWHGRHHTLPGGKGGERGLSRTTRSAYEIHR